LDALDEKQAKALRTWFVAHVDIKPRQSKGGSRKRKQDSNIVQLSLW